VFRKLKDKSFVITRPSRVGRKNPFLPIGYDGIISVKKDSNSLDQKGGVDFFGILSNNDNTEG
jgi:hypothetical protein